MPIHKGRKRADEETNRTSVSWKPAGRSEENSGVWLAPHQKCVVDRHEITDVLCDKDTALATRPSQQLLVRLPPQLRQVRSDPLRNRDHIISTQPELFGNRR